MLVDANFCLFDWHVGRQLHICMRACTHARTASGGGTGWWRVGIGERERMCMFLCVCVCVCVRARFCGCGFPCAHATIYTCTCVHFMCACAWHVSPDKYMLGIWQNRNLDRLLPLRFAGFLVLVRAGLLLTQGAGNAETGRFLEMARRTRLATPDGIACAFTWLRG